MNYSLEFERAKFRISINECDNVDELKTMANDLLDAYFNQRIIAEQMIGNLLLNAPMTFTPETLGQVAQDRDT